VGHPLKSHMGTWQSLAVAKAADLVVIPKECMPAEYAALSEQLCLAFCLLEQFGKLKVPLYMLASFRIVHLTAGILLIIYSHRSFITTKS